jgi:hypothetical protein
MPPATLSAPCVSWLQGLQGWDIALEAHQISRSMPRVLEKGCKVYMHARAQLNANLWFVRTWTCSFDWWIELQQIIMDELN